MHLMMKLVFGLVVLLVTLILAVCAQDGEDGSPAQTGQVAAGAALTADSWPLHDQAAFAFQVGGAIGANDSLVGLNQTSHQTNQTINITVAVPVYDIESHFKPKPVYEVDKYFRIKPTYDINNCFQFKPAVKLDDWPFVCNIV